MREHSTRTYTEPLSVIATRVFPSDASPLWLYLGVLIVAQFSGALFGAVTVALANAALLIVLLNDYQWHGGGSARRLRLALASVALAGVLSALVPCGGSARLIGTLLTYLMLLVSVGMVARHLRLGRFSLMLRLGSWRGQVLMAASGIPLGAIAIAVAPDLYGWPTGPQAGTVPWVLGSSLFAAFAEEILLRGLLLGLAMRALGAYGVVFSGFVSASLYIGSLSAFYVLLILAVSLYFCWFVWRTRAISGVVIAHFIMNSLLIELWQVH